MILSELMHFAKSDDWKNVLGEPSRQAIKRFVDEGMLMTADLNDLLSYKYKVSELKDLLRQRGLSISGRKDEMVQHLVQTDTNGMKKAVSELTLLKCTQRGHEIAEQYLVAEKEKRNKVERQVMEYLTRRKFKEASLAVAAYETEQVFPRGVGIDWKHYNPNHDIEILKTIFGSKPRIIAQLADAKLEALRIGAAMMALWGKNMAKEWLPANFETGLPFDNDTTARMFLFHALHRTTLERYRSEGLEHVEILPAPDSCESCRKLANKRYKLNEVPELPNEYCTHEMGCRCTLLPVVE